MMASDVLFALLYHQNASQIGWLLCYVHCHALAKANLQTVFADNLASCQVFAVGYA